MTDGVEPAVPVVPVEGEPLLRAVPDPEDPPATEYTIPPGSNAAAIAAVERVLEHVEFVDLAMALNTLRKDLPFANPALGTPGWLAGYLQEERKLEWREKAKESRARKLAPQGEVTETDLLAVDDTVEAAEILFRADGHALFYRGRTHNLVGESESGKTWLAMAACLAEVRNGGSALYYDFEDQARTFVRRLRDLGVTDAEIKDGFHYFSVDRDWAKGPETLVEKLAPTIVVLDGVTEGMGLLGLDPIGTPDAQKWVAWVRRWLGSNACVITIDHVVKDKNGQGRSALGSQHKMSGISGAHYVIEPAGLLRRGHESAVHIKVGKDRPGGVREFAGEALEHRMQYAGLLRFGLEGGAFEITLPDPDPLTEASGGHGDAAFLSGLHDFLDLMGEASMTAIEKNTTGVATGRKRALVASMRESGAIIARLKGTYLVYSNEAVWEPSTTPPEGLSWG